MNHDCEQNSLLEAESCQLIDSSFWQVLGLTCCNIGIPSIIQTLPTDATTYGDTSELTQDNAVIVPCLFSRRRPSCLAMARRTVSKQYDTVDFKSILRAFPMMTSLARSSRSLLKPISLPIITVVFLSTSWTVLSFIYFNGLLMFESVVPCSAEGYESTIALLVCSHQIAADFRWSDNTQGNMN